MNLRIYPPWWDDEMTLYCREVGEKGIVTWHACQLEGCYFAKIEATKTTDLTQKSDDTHLCRIREDDRFKTPDEWDSLTDKNGFFTLRAEDILIPRHVSDTVDEKAPGFRMNDLLQKYANIGAFRISSVQINTKGGSPHYRTTGVLR